MLYYQYVFHYFIYDILYYFNIYHFIYIILIYHILYYFILLLFYTISIFFTVAHLKLQCVGLVAMPQVPPGA